MKLVMFHTNQAPFAKPGLVVMDQESSFVVDIQSCIPDFPNTLKEAIETNRLAEIKSCAAHPSAIRHLLSSCRLAAPIQQPGKIFCVGLNYRDHALEGGRAVPEYPTLFQKAPSAVVGPHEPIVLPPLYSTRVDFEAELAVIIGKRTKNVSAANALDYVAGYTILNDVSARDLQRRTSQWTFGKSCDTFAPMGPYLVTPDSLPNPDQLEIQSFLNGAEMQHSNTKHLIFSISTLIEEISSTITLEPGDIIATGTPAGVGDFRDPPIYLAAGDVIEIVIEGMGTLSNPIQK